LAQPLALGAEDRRLLRDHRAIVGVDEVGRGSLAGPVVVCAVRWEEIPDNPLVRDSKRLTATRRAAVATWIRSRTATWTAVEIWPEVIDRINILEATRCAMRCSVRALRSPGDAVVVDAVDLGDGFEWAMHPIKADSQFFAVATASILAKTWRDDLMVEMAPRFGQWQWDQNKGYGTPAHRTAVLRSGRSYLHRESFKLASERG